MEKWEEARIERLEDRIVMLERKNWERSDFTFRLIMYGFTAAFVVLTLVAIAAAPLIQATSFVCISAARKVEAVCSWSGRESASRPAGS
jgi:hypothetical protein